MEQLNNETIRLAVTDYDNPEIISRFGNIELWDTSEVSDMSSLFRGAFKFNGDISLWNTSAVTDMSSLFEDAEGFNGDISRWNTSAVTDMNSMFKGASKFNKDLQRWDTSAVTDMSYMFSGAFIFNGDISLWNTSAVTDMGGMFEGAEGFNGDISLWKTGAVTDMAYMFIEASEFNKDLQHWDTSAVTDMSYMFLDAVSFDPLNSPFVEVRASAFIADMARKVDRDILLHSARFGTNQYEAPGGDTLLLVAQELRSRQSVEEWRERQVQMMDDASAKARYDTSVGTKLQRARAVVQMMDDASAKARSDTSVGTKLQRARAVVNPKAMIEKTHNTPFDEGIYNPDKLKFVREEDCMLARPNEAMETKNRYRNRRYSVGGLSPTSIRFGR